ncbi:hypothetical protein OAN22_01990 [Alphaproteobacteria bacterium]|nr:hypothetical protein [Alphaproteobacteria bacterium]
MRKVLLINLLFSLFIVLHALTINAASHQLGDDVDLDPVKEWYGSPAALTKEDIGKDAQIIAILQQVPALAEIFKKSTGVGEGWSIAEHSQYVINRFLKYCPDENFPEGVTKRDFILFLAFHDSGKAMAQEKVRRSGFESALNHKTYELLFSKALFEQVAQAVNMPERSRTVLAALLLSDNTGDYLQGKYSPAFAFNLYVRDAACRAIDVGSFMSLHTLFHMVDAGSYPSLSSLFDPDIEGAPLRMAYNSPLSRKMSAIHDLLQQHILAKKFMDESPKKGRSDLQDKDIITHGLHRYMYALRQQFYYSPNDYTTVVDEIFAAFGNDPILERDINYCVTAEVRAFIFQCQALQLERATRALPSVHGANSNILFGLVGSAATLIPGGLLGHFGSAPLSGELREGAQGINAENLSLSMATKEGVTRSINEYAKGFHLNMEQDNSEFIQWVKKVISALSGLPKLTNDDNDNTLDYSQVSAFFANKYAKDARMWPESASSFLGESPAREESMLDGYQMSAYFAAQRKKSGYFLESIIPGLEKWEISSRTPSMLRRIRLLFPEAFDSYKDVLKKAVCAFQTYMIDAAEIYPILEDEKLASECELLSIDTTNHRKIKSLKRTLQELYKILFDEPTPSTLPAEMLAGLRSAPFPILFESWVPCHQPNIDHERAYNGMLRLGIEIKRLLVPEERIRDMKKWCTVHVPNGLKIQVDPLEAYQKEFTHVNASPDDCCFIC